MPSSSSAVSPLSRALAAADQALDAPRRAGIPLGNWRWVVRQRVVAVRELLTTETGREPARDPGGGSAPGGGPTREGWLDARGGRAFDERNELLARAQRLAQEVLESPDVEKTRLQLKQLLVDVHRHVQRQADRR